MEIKTEHILIVGGLVLFLSSGLTDALANILGQVGQAFADVTGLVRGGAEVAQGAASTAEDLANQAANYANAAANSDAGQALTQQGNSLGQFFANTFGLGSSVLDFGAGAFSSATSFVESFTSWIGF